MWPLSTHLVLVTKRGEEGVLGQWSSTLTKLKVGTFALHLEVMYLMPVG